MFLLTMKHELYEVFMNQKYSDQKQSYQFIFLILNSCCINYIFLILMSTPVPSLPMRDFPLLDLCTSLPLRLILQSSNIRNIINKYNPLMIFTKCNKRTILPYSLSCFQQSWTTRKSQ